MDIVFLQKSVRMDLIYEGITTTPGISLFLPLVVRMDLIYEGITTAGWRS